VVPFGAGGATVVVGDPGASCATVAVALGDEHAAIPTTSAQSLRKFSTGTLTSNVRFLGSNLRHLATVIRADVSSVTRVVSNVSLRLKNCTAESLSPKFQLRKVSPIGLKELAVTRGGDRIRVEEAVMANGTVKWFNDAKGYGFISRSDDNKDVFVHYSSISGEGFRTLNQGQTVEYEEQQGPKGLFAARVLKVIS
jgi:CspA family cold shock protein